jgi:hypothetical protein
MRRAASLNRAKFILPVAVVLCALFLWGHSLPSAKEGPPSPPGNHDFFPGDFSSQGIIGQNLPGTWRAFSETSLWNKEIPPDALTHPDSEIIIAYASAEARNIRLPNIYTIPLWIVNSDTMPHVKVRSDKIFDTWDKDEDGWSDVGVPITKSMWAEPTRDGHICIIDPFKKIAWEMSRFRFLEDGTPSCTTFNIWDLTGTGAGTPFEGKRWWARGGRGSGFPVIAGLIRPEELAAGEIRHALEFSFSKNRRGDKGQTILLPPACRSDGKYKGRQYPIEGMQFQLDPALTDKDFDAWGLNREGKIVARALQRYGMYLGDNGGPMALKVQLLAPSVEGNRKRWEELFPGFYENIKRIPTNKFRVVYTGEPLMKKRDAS